MMGQPQALCEEDEIINRLRESRSDGEMFFDVEFGGVATALYENESEVPEYDQDLSEPVVWLRPQELAHSPEYFVDGALSGSVVEGRLGDGWLLGAMAAISGHPELLVENLFGSDPDDFKKWGVYTCRFYKNGSWVEVTTDTRAPATSGFGDGGAHGSPEPIYGRCLDPREQWVSLLEKAYAKLHGSYEALSGGSVTEALVDLTGGSGEEVKLEEKDHARLWDLVKAHAEKKHVLCGTVDVGEGLEAVRSTELRETPLGLLPAHAYGVLACVEVADQRFLHMRNPWGKGEGNGDWRGPWSNASTQWDDFPEVLTEMMNDESLAWDRNANDGTFFMAFEDFCARFDTLHVCKLFVDDRYKQYKVVGKWSGKTAGGPDAKFEAKQKADLAAAADGAPAPPPPAGGAASGPDRRASRDRAGPGDELNDASLKLANALRDHHGKFVRTDGDPYWFNNPQFRVTTQAPVEVHVSLTQCKNPTAPAATKGHFKMAFEVLRTKRNAEHPRIWSLDGAELVAHAPGLPAAATREVSLSGLLLEPGWNYSVVAHATLRGREAPFVLRIFSPGELKVAPAPETHSQYVPGAWQADLEHDTAGGPPLLSGPKHGVLKVAPKWCHNPQYHLKLVDGDPGRDPDAPEPANAGTVDIKLVLRRTDAAPQAAEPRKKGLPRKSSAGNIDAAGSSRALGGGGDDAAVTTVGLVVCKAPAPEEELGRRVHKETKTNALGEPKPTKESTLRKKRPKPGVAEARQLLEGLGGASWGAGIGGLGGGFEGEPEKAMPPRKMLLEANEWHQTSNFRGATVATLLLPGIVKSRMPNGMVVVPCLSDVDTQGSFVLEVHSDAPVSVEAVSESKSKTVVGEWVDSNSGGSHLQPSWKTNPKYKLTFANATARAKVNITLTRPEADWKMRDMVGSMMGFYLSRGAAPSTPNPGNQSPSSDGAAIFHEGKPWNESPFVPMHSVSTPPGFALEATDGSYVIMPATYAPNKKGRFFLSVTSDVDFVLTGAGGTTSVTH